MLWRAEQVTNLLHKCFATEQRTPSYRNIDLLILKTTHDFFGHSAQQTQTRNLAGKVGPSCVMQVVNLHWLSTTDITLTFFFKSATFLTLLKN